MTRVAPANLPMRCPSDVGGRPPRQSGFPFAPRPCNLVHPPQAKFGIGGASARRACSRARLAYDGRSRGDRNIGWLAWRFHQGIQQAVTVVPTSLRQKFRVRRQLHCPRAGFRHIAVRGPHVLPCGFEHRATSPSCQSGLRMTALRLGVSLIASAIRRRWSLIVARQEFVRFSG